MMDVETLNDSEIVKLNRGVDWKRYLAIYMTGIEKFILKEEFKSIVASRQRLSAYVQEYFRIEKNTYITGGSSI